MVRINLVKSHLVVKLSRCDLPPTSASSFFTSSHIKLLNKMLVTRRYDYKCNIYKSLSVIFKIGGLKDQELRRKIEKVEKFWFKR